MNLLRKALKANFNLSIIGSYVKQHLQNSVVKIMHNYGFYVDELPDAASFYMKLKNYPVAAKEDELRRMTLFLRKANNRSLYDQILRKFVPQMDINFSDSKFIGKGFGATTLNVYRKVFFNSEVLFEKVYFNSSLDTERVKWFYDNIYSSMNGNIVAPPLYRSIKGELVTIFYFKFVNLFPLADKDVEATIFNFSRELYKLSQLVDVREKIENAPVFLKDYTAHFEYKRKIEKAELRAVELLGDRFPFRKIEKKIRESPITLSHADMHKGNVFANNYLIDWDPFGIYPIGLEVAYILLFMKQCKLNYKELIDILKREYQTTIAKEEWSEFQLNCLYFYFVFTIHSSNEEGSSNIQSDILNRIEELYDRNIN